MEGLVTGMIKGCSTFYKGKGVLVTGHTGFKGSWLTEWLLMMGARVTGFALAPATEPALFDQLGLAARCDHRIGDIRNRALVKSVIHEIRPDIIFHLAAQPLVRLSYVQPVETYETNVMGTSHVLDALRDADWTCAAVMITTDKVYENKEWLHAYRESDPLGGYDPYSSSKACAELLIQSYRQSFFNPVELEQKLAMNEMVGGIVGVASARAGNVIGGGDWAQDRIVPDCVRALMKGDPIVVRNPHATRPWQHVLEPLSGYLLLGMCLREALSKTPEAKGPLSKICHSLPAICSTFNFGPALAANRPVRELVEAILKRWPGKWSENCEMNALHEAGMLNLATDKSFHVLGWSASWTFEETIDATMDWYMAMHKDEPGIARTLVRDQIKKYIENRSGMSDCR